MLLTTVADVRMWSRAYGYLTKMYVAMYFVKKLITKHGYNLPYFLY